MFRSGEFPPRSKSVNFLERVVAFPAVLTGNEREALIGVADRLSIELGYEGGAEIAGAYSPSGGEGGPMAGLNSEDELLVTTMKRGLAKIAAALAGEGSDGGASTSAVKAALDGAEMVMRGELLRGNAAQLPALMPSFVFLVALPVVDQDRALSLSRRTAELLDAAFDR